LAGQDTINSQRPKPEISGVGKPGYTPVFTSSTKLANSQLFQGSGIDAGSGAHILFGIGTNQPQATLHLNAGGTGNYDMLLLGRCDNPVNWGKCLILRDTGSAIDIQTLGVPFYIYGGDILLNPYLSLGTPGFVGIGVIQPDHILTIAQGAGVAIADGWTTYSSRRWKENIVPLEGALDKVLRLQGVAFDWKASGKHDVGVVAEEVAAVIPEAVAFDSNQKEARSVDYGRLTALLIEAVKEQQKEIDSLKRQISGR